MTLVEVLLTLAVVTVLLAGLSTVLAEALNQWRHGQGRSELLYQGRFAMERMVEAASRSRRLMVPLADNPATPWEEDEREILAVTLDPGLDRDSDGFADADNDKDGLIDEDIPTDNTNDTVTGIIGIDDDGDGTIDELAAGGDGYTDNDEDGSKREDCIDGIDNDGDGTVDEDIPKDNDRLGGDKNPYDNDGDGLKHEDWLDPVVFFVSADEKRLMERMPDLNPVSGADFTERAIAEAESVELEVERLTMEPDERAVQVKITLNLKDAQGESATFKAQVRVGRGE